VAAGAGRMEKEKKQPSSTGSWMGMWGWRGLGSKGGDSPSATVEGLPIAGGIVPANGHALSPPSLSLPTTRPSLTDPTRLDLTSLPSFIDDDLSYPPYPTPPHLRAIFLSTRLLAVDAASLFSDAVSAGPLIGRLAFDLVSAARERNITVTETRQSSRALPKALSTRSSSSSVPQVPAERASASNLPPRKPSMGIVEQPLLAASSALSRALNAASKSRPSSRSISRPKASTLTQAPAELDGSARSGEGTSSSETMPIPSVELDSIEPQESRPPTLISDRTGLRRLFSTHRSASEAAKARRSSRFGGGLEPLTDKYGFIYDTRNLALLREASDAGAPAPAVFAGLPRVEPEGAEDESGEEDWVENNVVLSPGESPRRPTSSGARTPASAEMHLSGSSASGVSISFAEGSQLLSSAPRSNGRHRSSTILSLNPSPARASAAPQTVHVSADVTATDVDQNLTPSHRQTFGLTGRKVGSLRRQTGQLMTI